MSSTRCWRSTDDGTCLLKETSKDSDTPVKLGCYGRVSAQVPLTSDGGICLEAGASYRWVDELKVSDDVTEAKIDLSSWEGRIGICIPLD